MLPSGPTLYKQHFRAKADPWVVWFWYKCGSPCCQKCSQARQGQGLKFPKVLFLVTCGAHHLSRSTVLSPELWGTACPGTSLSSQSQKLIKRSPGRDSGECWQVASDAEEAGPWWRLQTRGVCKRERVQCRHGHGCGRAAGLLTDLEAICKADQLQVVFQPWQMVPGWTNVTFPWINNLRKIDEENRHTCPLLAYLNISLGTSSSFLQNTLVRCGNI